MYQMKTPNATMTLESEHPLLHFPVPFQLATAAKADSHAMHRNRSTATRAYGLANLRVRGKRGVMVWYMIAGTVRNICQLVSDLFIT
jgi:hypothetical protein